MGKVGKESALSHATSQGVESTLIRAQTGVGRASGRAAIKLAERLIYLRINGPGEKPQPKPDGKVYTWAQIGWPLGVDAQYLAQIARAERPASSKALIALGLRRPKVESECRFRMSKREAQTIHRIVMEHATTDEIRTLIDVMNRIAYQARELEDPEPAG